MIEITRGQLSPDAVKMVKDLAEVNKSSESDAVIMLLEISAETSLSRRQEEAYPYMTIDVPKSGDNNLLVQYEKYLKLLHIALAGGAVYLPIEETIPYTANISPEVMEALKEIEPRDPGPSFWDPWEWMGPTNLIRFKPYRDQE